MSENDNKVLEVINHYQDALNRYVSRGEEPKILHCLDKLRCLPITVSHLEETGVGRSVNSLRKVEGDVGEGARRLVNQWKEMVEQHTQHDSDNQEDMEQECVEIEENSSPNNSNTSTLHYKDDKKSSTKKEHGKERNGESNRHSRDESSSKRREKSSGSCHKSSTKSKRKHESSSRAAEDDSDNSEELDDGKKRKHDERIKENSSKNKKHRDSNQTSSTDKEKDSEKTERSKEKERKDKNRRDHHEKETVEYQKLNSRKKESFKERERADIGNESNSKNSDNTNKEEKRKNECSTAKKPDKNATSSKISNKSSSSGSKIIKEKLKNVDSIDSESGASFAEALGMLEPLPPIKAAKKKSHVQINRNDAKTTSGYSTIEASSSYKRKLSPPRSTVEKYVANDDSPVDMLDDENDTELNDVPNLLSNPPKFDTLEINISSLLPALTPNYRPIPNNPLLNENPRHKALTEYENLSNVISSKNARTKVYSGNKVSFGKIPSLFELCIRILMDNIDALEYTGGVPYMILKPILEKCTPDQLLMLEHFNPYLIEDTDGLWNFHCQREFRNKKREEWESWREMYNRCVDEREAKLRALTANIKQSQDNCLPVRQTKLAYVDSVAKPPRGVARKQQKNGYIPPDVKSPLVTPSSRLSAIAQSGSAGLVSVPSPGLRAAIGASSNAVMKIKKAPLMQKTLQLMKGRFRR